MKKLRNDGKSVCPFMGGGQRMVKLWGALLFMFFIWFLGQDINLDVVLSLAPVAILIYFILFYFTLFSLSNVFYIFSYILTDTMQRIQ